MDNRTLLMIAGAWAFLSLCSLVFFVGASKIERHNECSKPPEDSL